MNRQPIACLSMIAAGAACVALVSQPAFARSQDAMQKLVASGAQFAGSNARIASEVCGVDAATIASYKSASGKKFAQDPKFAADWDTGWQRAKNTVTGMNEMKSRDPQQYASQKATTCRDMAKEVKG